MATDGDPTRIRSLAVTVEDVVTALELNRTTARRAVLRVTPPFSGRMRARLHVVIDEDEDEPGPIHVEPESLVEPDVPEYPTAADTEAALRADPEKRYTVDRHHEYHVEAVAAWRRAVADSVRTRVTLEGATDPQTVDVVTLGELDAERARIDESRL